VQADVQPRWARLLVKGRLLQLKLPCEVSPDHSNAQRSKASGRLVLTMPKLNPGDKSLDLACLRARVDPSALRESLPANLGIPAHGANDRHALWPLHHNMITGALLCSHSMELT
jgi:hypothetical protein